MKMTVTFLSGAAVGAALASIADPTLGKRRRAIARDAAVHLARVFDRAVEIGIQDTRNRIKGIFKESKRSIEGESIDDYTLEDRVRTAVGRVSSHPNVEVIVAEGCVTLLGPVVDREEELVLKAAKAVPGVTAVKNRMKPYEALHSMPTQQPKPAPPLDIMRRRWAPATRVAVGAIASSLIAGSVRGGRRGVLPGLAGLALLARAATNMEFRRLLGFKSGRPAVATLLGRRKRA